MQNLVRFLHARGADRPVLEDVAELVVGLNGLANQVRTLGATLVVYETLLEHHGLLSPEIMETIKPLLEAKVNPKADAPAEDKSSIDDTPESRPEAT